MRESPPKLSHRARRAGPDNIGLPGQCHGREPDLGPLGAGLGSGSHRSSSASALEVREAGDLSEPLLITRQSQPTHQSVTHFAASPAGPYPVAAQ